MINLYIEVNDPLKRLERNPKIEEPRKAESRRERARNFGLRLKNCKMPSGFGGGNYGTHIA